MSAITLVNVAAAVGGLILVGAVSWALIKFPPPPPYRNAIFGVIALGMFAIGAVSKLDVALDKNGKIEMKINELAKTISDQQQQIASLTTSEQKVAQLEKTISDQHQQIASLVSLNQMVDYQKNQINRLGEQTESLVVTNNLYAGYFNKLSKAFEVKNDTDSGRAVIANPNNWEAFQNNLKDTNNTKYWLNTKDWLNAKDWLNIKDLGKKKDWFNTKDWYLNLDQPYQLNLDQPK